MELGKSCVHGSLERSCEICERDTEIAELKAENQRLAKMFVDMKAFADCVELKLIRTEAENARLWRALHDIESKYADIVRIAATARKERG